MSATVNALPQPTNKSWLDRALSIFTDVRPGEGATAVLMLVNIFLLLVCYSVIKTVREPLILLGGGAEVRSYAAAGQALLLMGFVPLYSWFASRVDRAKLLVGATLFFIVCIELFSTDVAARVPYVGVAFFIWVGIFNMSLVAQFWSFANDIYNKEAGDRLFPIIVMGMTAGAPFGSFIAARLFRVGFTPQIILQISALLLSVSVVLYLRINRRETTRTAVPQAPMATAGGFRLVLSNSYLRLIALLVVLLNIVNTTGEYLVARLLTNHVNVLAASDATFNKQAYIGAFSGDYQFWVNIAAFLLQAFVTSRLVKYKGIRGALLALPLIALGGYAIVAAGVGFSVVRWIKTAENATDYSIMNTARQLLWLPTTREEKYKAKQAIDTFFVRTGDLLSAAAVFLGTSVLHLKVDQFAAVNVVLTLAWIGVALLILKPHRAFPRISFRPLVHRAAAAALLIFAVVAPAMGQETREERLAAARLEKAKTLHPYEPNSLERRLERVDRLMSTERSIYPFMGSVLEGGGFAFGPGYRARYGDSGTFNAHAAWSVRSYKTADAALTLPTFGNKRVSLELHGNWLDAPQVTFFGIGQNSRKDDRTSFSYRATTVGASARVHPARFVTVGGSLDAIGIDAVPAGHLVSISALSPTYRRTQLFSQIDWRTSPNYTRRGGFYRMNWSDYRQTNAGGNAFRRLDTEIQQFVPLLRENWVLAFRASASTTDTAPGQEVPYFLMPDLGGSHMLRGYSTWRFRDRNRVVFTGEYRWTAGPFVDMALFIDAGKVAARRADLNLHNLSTTRGLGVSFHTPNATLARIEVARSREGTSLILSFSPSF
jgi:AAA family ATP:ADP antiporter